MVSKRFHQLKSAVEDTRRKKAFAQHQELQHDPLNKRQDDPDDTYIEMLDKIRKNHDPIDTYEEFHKVFLSELKHSNAEPKQEPIDTKNLFSQYLEKMKMEHNDSSSDRLKPKPPGLG